MLNRIVIHYSEIALKGKNRSYFENALVRHIKTALGDSAKVHKRYGRIVCTPAADADLDTVRRTLARIPGIVHFAIGAAADKDVEKIKEAAGALLAEADFATFGVRTKRSDKSFPVKSDEISRDVGGYLAATLEKKVNLTAPDLWLYIELTHQEALLYARKIPGPGGLPIGTSGRVVASLSGGIDSPVAAYLMMKRGCAVDFVHIRNETQFAQDAVGKIEDLVRCLTGFQLRSRLFIVPFGELQRAIIAFVPAKYRMIIYRRFMMRILNRIAAAQKAGGIVTGDSVGQVASQTLDNLHCIQAAARLPVLSPLVGMNKDETIAIAEKIGTFEFSTLPYPDCCSFMIAAHPETRGDLSEIERFEEGIEGAEELIDRCVAEATVKTFSHRS